MFSRVRLYIHLSAAFHSKQYSINNVYMSCLLVLMWKEVDPYSYKEGHRSYVRVTI